MAYSLYSFLPYSLANILLEDEKTFILYSSRINDAADSVNFAYPTHRTILNCMDNSAGARMRQSAKLRQGTLTGRWRSGKQCRRCGLARSERVHPPCRI